MLAASPALLSEALNFSMTNGVIVVSSKKYITLIKKDVSVIKIKSFVHNRGLDISIAKSPFTCFLHLKSKPDQSSLG